MTKIVLGVSILLLFPGCFYKDDLQRLVDQADRRSYQALQDGRTGTGAARSASQVIQTFYYTQKYKGNPEQIRRALEQGQKSVRTAERTTSRSSRTQSLPSGTARISSNANDTPPLPRYLAVQVGQNPENKNKQIMIYDTVRNSVLGNDVYETPKAPPKGQVIRIDSIEATTAQTSP